ncbi:putative 28S ribosomal protein S10, mitochondrial [Stylophora pistillata]|uniref:Small ribosomal subunit protein uS10m n=2 Tax=Stylophora pistillata TaxID=50429 RepID=A0A2B4R8N3_STYPI|nr:putative 28S ribosomal protein S10, mitochondrial [Stylophora pistillata]
MNLGRSLKPVLTSTGCLSSKNEVLELAGQTSLVGLFHQHRRKGFLGTERNYGNKHLHSKQFSTDSGHHTPNSQKETLYSLINIKYKGSDEAVLRSYTKFMTMAAKHLDIDISDRILLPTAIERYTILKSPHIFKKHRAQYEIRTHGRMLQVRNVTQETADVFLEYVQRNIPEGVSMKVEQTELESISDYFVLPPEAQEFLEHQKSNQEKRE